MGFTVLIKTMTLVLVMRQTCHEVLQELKINNPLFDVAMELERIALNDPYFIEKNLYPER